MVVIKPYTIDELRETINKNIWHKRRNIYLVNPLVVAKFAGYIESAQHEQRMGRAVNGKANTPEVYGAELVDGNWYSMMQYVEGTTIGTHIVTEGTGILDSRDEEITKVLALGILPVDCFDFSNCLVAPDRKVFLVDFERWAYGTKEEIELVRRHLVKRYFIA